jgi:hypothetical protein
MNVLLLLTLKSRTTGGPLTSSSICRVAIHAPKFGLKTARTHSPSLTSSRGGLQCSRRERSWGLDRGAGDPFLNPDRRFVLWDLVEPI